MSDIDAPALIAAAREAARNAHAPYSNFAVGAALLMSDGSIVTPIPVAVGLHARPPENPVQSTTRLQHHTRSRVVRRLSEPSTADVWCRHRDLARS